jgi:DTW domain-containing protein YfiP
MTMNLKSYLEMRLKLQDQEPKFRTICHACFQPDFNCYCTHIKHFDPKMKFVILMHNLEAKRRVATGRLSHLCLENSELLVGHDFSQNRDVNSILANDQYHSVILYPGRNSFNLSDASAQQRADYFPQDKKLALFVIDGTWNTARKMVRSSNLTKLPRICFSPPKPSNFRVRKQPAPGCYSTLEAIHHTIELLGPSRGFNPATRTHDHLLHVFDTMVEKQLEYVRRSHTTQTHSRHRRTA